MDTINKLDSNEGTSSKTTSRLHEITPFSKYLTIFIFILLPFLGGYVGYKLASVTVVEIEHVVYRQTQNKPLEESTPQILDTQKQIEAVTWNIEIANPDITDPDDFKQYEQNVTATVFFNDASIQTVDLGTAYGCSAVEQIPADSEKHILGRVNCYFSLTGVTFTAYTKDGYSIIEKHSDDASGETDGTTEVLFKL